MRHTYSKRLRAIRTTFINVTSSLVLLGSSMSAALPLFFTQTAHAAGNNIVTAGHPLGWAFTTTGDATSQYTTDPSVQISGNGSYELRSDSGKKGYLYDSSYASRDLTSLKHLSYSYYVANRNAGTSVAPALSLITTINGTWTELKVEPTYTNGAPAGSWQTIDAFAPTTKWYSTHDLQDVHGDTIVHKFNGVADLVSWDTLVGLDHSAKLGTDDGANGVRFTIGQNSGGAPWSNFDAYIDNVNINDNVYDFEPTIVPSVHAENFNTNSDSSYKGINVGFNISNFKTVSKVSVSLYRDNTLLVTNTQNQNLLDLIAGGTTELSTPFIIQDGTYHEDYWNLGVHNWKSSDKPTKALISVTGTDGDGNTVTKTAENDNFVEPNGWTFDSLLPPSVPNTPANLYFTQGTDTLSCGSATNSDSVPTLHWTAPSGNLYQYVITPSYPDNSGEYQAYPAGSATAWWVTGNFANHGQGVYTYTIKAENTAGQWSSLATCSLTYDTIAPTVTVTPVAGSLLHGIETFEITINDADPVSSHNSSIWTYLYDTTGGQKSQGAKVDLSSGTGTFTVDTTKLDDGNANLDVAIVHDAAGNASGRSDNYFRNYTIDNTVNTSTNGAPNGVYLNTNDFDFTWDEVIDASGPVTYQFQSSLNPSQVNGVLTTNLWHSDTLPSAMIHSSGAPDGTWYWQVRALDNLGNTSNWSPIWTVTLDTKAPDAPTIKTPTPRQWFKTAPILDSWTPVTDPSGISHYQIAYNYDDGHSFGSSTCPGVTITGATGFIGCRDVSGTSRDHQPASWEQGGVTIWVRAIDNAGNASAWSKSVHYYYDYSAPTNVDVTFPADLSIVNSTNGELTVTGTATDNLSMNRVGVQLVKPGVSGQIAYIYANDNKMVYTNPGTWQATFDTNALNLADGVYGINVYATDMAGNTTVKQITFTLDNTAPAVPTNLSWLGTNSNPATNGFTNAQTGNLSWEDNDPTVNHYLYKFWTNIPGHTNTWTTEDSKYFTPTSTGSSIWTNFLYGDGTYSFCVAAVDAIGNTSACSDIYSVTYDSTAPDAPVATPGSSIITTGTQVTLSDTDNTATIYYTTDGTTPDNTSTVYSGPLTVSGDETIKTIAYDPAGNSSNVATASYTIKKAQPFKSNAVTSTNGNNTTPNNSNQAVLGANTSTPNTPSGTNNSDKTDGQIKGDQTTNKNTDSSNKDKTVNNSSAFLGLGWWWLLVLALILGFLWVVLRKADTDDKKA